MFYSIALIAYLLDFFFSEFEKVKFKLPISHPIILMGNYIKFFEKKFYKDSILRGFFLTMSLLAIVFIISYILSLIDNIFIQGFLASFTLSSKMLYTAVKDVIDQNTIEDKRVKISYLVSRDTSELSNSDINKASVETYAENLSDGVIAPLFYLLCFGIIGAFVYKAVNTLDSMVGYRNQRYERFGKVSAYLDDLVNFIPARITAVLISLLFLSKEAFINFYQSGKHHASLNAGLPIASMAYSLNIKLGGPTSYFGEVKKKPFFGIGRKNIDDTDVLKALSLKYRIDIFIILILILGVFL